MKQTTEQQKFLAGGEKTLNNTGYMTGQLDSYSKLFVEYAGKVSGPIMDIGACYGVAVLPALAKSATVIATDNDSRHLEILKSRAPEKNRERLKCVVGSLPNDLHFEKNSISAILCCRVLHLLKEDEIDISVNHMYDWLKPGGRIYLINDTPYARYSDKMLKEFLPIHDQLKNEGKHWPGYISNLKHYLQPEFHHLAPDHVTLTDVDALVDVCERIGFKVIQSGYISRTDYPESLQNDGRENAGVIAIKN